MTQTYTANGRVVPITILSVGPCVVTQIMNQDKDGYSAVQVGYGNRKKKNIAKAQQGHMKDLGSFAQLKEFRVDDNSAYKVGDTLNVEQFEEGEKVKVSGTSKGKGFQGVVKRHGFSGSPASHGHKDQLRMPGSIGATGPQKVFKGTKMAGQMGNKPSTSLNLEIVKVDSDNNELHVKGAVPGARNSLIAVFI